MYIYDTKHHNLRHNNMSDRRQAQSQAVSWS